MSDYLDKKIYIDVSDLNILYRRTKRDDTSAHIDYTMFTVIPESKKYVDKQKASSDIIIDGNRDKDIVYSDVFKYLNFVISQSSATNMNQNKHSNKPGSIIGFVKSLLD